MSSRAMFVGLAIFLLAGEHPSWAFVSLIWAFVAAFTQYEREQAARREKRDE